MTIEQFAKQEIELLARRRAAATAIVVAESAAGAALLDVVEGDTAASSVDQIQRARDELGQLDAAIKICHARRSAACRAKRQAEAGGLRRQAAELHDQAEKIEAKVARALALVADVQGTAFNPPTVALGGDLPLSLKLRSEAAALENRAADLESELPRSGVLDCDGTATNDLIEAMLLVERETPTTEAIVAWAAACEKRSGRDFGKHARRFHVQWHDGAIDLGQSYIQVSALIKTTEGSLGGVVRELGTDMFKSTAAAAA
jgi:hypothetical protein